MHTAYAGRITMSLVEGKPNKRNFDVLIKKDPL
jgi:hypothetical protein